MISHIGAKEAIRCLFHSQFKLYYQNGIPTHKPVIPPLAFKQFGTGTVYTPEVIYRNVEPRKQEDNGQHFLHFMMKNASRVQTTLTGTAAHTVGTQYNTRGHVTVEVYFSKQAYRSDDEDYLTEILQRVFQQRYADCVWFKNAIIVDLEAEEKYFRSNVLAEFEYDSVIT